LTLTSSDGMLKTLSVTPLLASSTEETEPESRFVSEQKLTPSGRQGDMSWFTHTSSRVEVAYYSTQMFR